MKYSGELNRAEAHQIEGGLISLYHFNVGMATAQFRFDTPQLLGLNGNPAKRSRSGDPVQRGLGKLHLK